MRASVFALIFTMWRVKRVRIKKRYEEETKLEIERKFLVKKENLPENLEQYPSKVIEQGCGFHQVSHYINLFKKHEGCTPLKFRREWHSNEAIKPPDAQ